MQRFKIKQRVHKIRKHTHTPLRIAVFKDGWMILYSVRAGLFLYRQVNLPESSD